MATGLEVLVPQNDYTSRGGIVTEACLNIYRRWRDFQISDAFQAFKGARRKGGPRALTDASMLCPRIDAEQ